MKKKVAAIPEKKGRKVYVVDADDQFEKFLKQYKADLLKTHAVKIGDGPALYKIALEYFRAQYPELAKSATGG